MMDPYVYTALGTGHLSKPPGLSNLNNSCFVTAIIQCLFSLEGFKARLCQGFLRNDNDSTQQPITSALQLLFLDLTVCQESNFFCFEFMDALKSHWLQFQPGVQDDAADFLQYVLRRVHEETLEPARNLPSSLFFEGDMEDPRCIAQHCWKNLAKSPIMSMFGIQIVTSVVCSGVACSYTYDHCDEPSMYLTVPLTSSQGTCSIRQCLEQYFKEASIEDAACSKCGRKGTLKTKYTLSRLPPVLIVHLSRFAHPGGHDQIGKKIDRLVSYEHILQMGDFVLDGLQSNTNYSLVCVTNHVGKLNAGHYTSYCCREERWFSFDDSKVTNITSRRVISNNAYILWYKLNVDKIQKALTFDNETEFHSVLPEGTQLSFDKNNNLIQEDVSTPEKAPLVELPIVEQPVAKTPAVEMPVPKRCGGSLEVTVTTPPCGGSLEVTDTTPPASSPVLFSSAKFDKETDHTNKALQLESCEHPEINLDVRDPRLTLQDVRGGDKDPNRATVKELERLLRIYGLPIKGNKNELIDRIKQHIAMGKGNKVDPAVDKGETHARKRIKLMGQRTLGNELPILPPYAKAWKPFPSVHIPEGFSYHKINSYFNELPSMNFTYQDGVISATPQEVLQEYHVDTSDEEVSDEEVPSKNITYLCQRAIVKCIDKGKQFLSSGRVLSVFDTCKDKHYIIKAQVQASMEATVYVAIIYLSMEDGSICGAECSCKAQTLHRCGHIAAVSLMLWEHVLAKGNEAVTTTGRECYWRKAAPPKDPAFIREKSYPSRKDKTARIQFDPRPSAFKEEGPARPEQLESFKSKLLQAVPMCLFLYHLEAGFLHSPETPESELTTANEDNLPSLCNKLMEDIVKRCEGHSCPFEVPSTLGQHLSPQWHKERRDVVNASSAKALLGLTSSRRKIKFFRQKLWGLDKFESKAMIDGRHFESIARKEYEQHLQAQCHEFQIVEAGLWKNPKYPQMACSPDGFIIIENYLRVLLEIKVLTVLCQSTEAPVDPNNFEQEMSKEQQKNFYLRRDATGSIILKPTHPYQYQIQMSLDILEIEFCHLYVWSKTGSMMVLIRSDPAFWQEKRQRLIRRHITMIVPEVILGRTKRWLPIIEMEYAENPEEDPDDPVN